MTAKPVLETIRINRSSGFDEMVPPARRIAWYCNSEAVGQVSHIGVSGAQGDDAEFYWGDFNYDQQWDYNPMKLLGRGFITGRDEKTYVDDPVGAIKVPEALADQIPLEDAYSQ